MGFTPFPSAWFHTRLISPFLSGSFAKFWAKYTETQSPNVWTKEQSNLGDVTGSSVLGEIPSTFLMWWGTRKGICLQLTIWKLTAALAALAPKSSPVLLHQRCRNLQLYFLNFIKFTHRRGKGRTFLPTFLLFNF